MRANAIRVAGSVMVVVALMGIIDLRVNHADDETLRRFSRICPPGDPLIPGGVAACLLLAGAALIGLGFALQHRREGGAGMPVDPPGDSRLGGDERMFRTLGGVETTGRVLKMVAIAAIALVLWGLWQSYESVDALGVESRLAAAAAEVAWHARTGGALRSGAPTMSFDLSHVLVCPRPPLLLLVVMLGVPAAFVAGALIMVAGYERDHRRELQR